jgi:hypothetical protein
VPTDRELRRIFGQEREEERECVKLHNEVLYNLCPPNVIRMMKSWDIRWSRNVSRMERREIHAKLWKETPKARNQFWDTWV